MRLCQQCNEPIPDTRNAKAKYCTAKCGSTASRNSSTRVCTKDECERRVRARGLCATHYNQAHLTKRHSKKLVACAWCGTEVLKYPGGGRKHGQVCSDSCRQYLATPYCVLPADHWARWYGKSSEWKPKPAPGKVPKMQRECEWCGAGYETHQSSAMYCTTSCSRKASKLRRRARECGAPGMYSWTQVIALFLAADRLCAYCDVRIEGQPDPDHVTPLSRGGRNDIGNIVACCHSCNADKCDMTLTEWAEDRLLRGKPALRYELPFNDQRFKHLALDEATGSAWRHQLQLQLAA